MSKLKAKPKKRVGRPAEYLNPEKAFEYFDEQAWQEAKSIYDQWEEEYNNCKIITGKEHETIKQYEDELRSQYPQLNKLGIEQLYIVAGKDIDTIRKAYRDLEIKSKPPIDKDTYTVKIPAEKANEYSWYLAIAEAFNNIRENGNTAINTAMLPRITANRIVLDYRSMKLTPNPYLFTKNNQ